MSNGNGNTAVATRNTDMAAPIKSGAGARELLDTMQDQIQKALPKHLTPERMIRVAVTAIRANPGLLKCSKLSVAKSIIVASQLGLEPDGVTGRAYLVPYNNRKTGHSECQFIPGYRGLIELAYRNERVRRIQAYAVHENDDFDITLGDKPSITHKPNIRGDRGGVIGYYAICEIKDGAPLWEYMSRPEVEDHRDRFSKAAKSGPWVSDFDAMALKTVVRKLYKWLPSSIEIEKVIELENQVEQEYASFEARRRQAQNLDDLTDRMAVAEVSAEDDDGEPEPAHDPETGEIVEESDGQAEEPEAPKAGYDDLV